MTSLLEGLAGRPVLVVWNYHRIGDPDLQEFDDGVFSATADQFDAQVQVLHRAYEVIGLPELLDILDRPSRLRRTATLITFDDGYIDNYRVAFPILRARGLTATFFLPTAFVGTTRLPWWDAVASAIRLSDRDEVTLNYPVPRRIPLDRPRCRRAIHTVLSEFLRPRVEIGRFLEAVSEAAGRVLPDQTPERLFMNWEEAREIVASGMTVGSHAHSHRPFDNLSAEQWQSEFETSARILEEQVGVPATAFAYPTGTRMPDSGHVEDKLRAAGYACAFSYRGGLNFASRLDRYQLCRVGLHPSCSIDQFRLRMGVAGALGLELA